MQTTELLHSYFVDINTWDEMYADATIRSQYLSVVEFLQQLSLDELNKKEELAKRGAKECSLLIPGILQNTCAQILESSVIPS